MNRRTALRTLASASVLPLVASADLEALMVARRALACPVETPWTPAALSEHQLAMVRVVAELILPATDTPGASDVGVDRFIDVIVSEWFDPDEASVFTDGLSALDAAAERDHGQDFLSSGPEAQMAMVEGLDQELTTLRQRDEQAQTSQANDTFFHWMKRLTLTGYFTSEEGMAVLQRRTIPGRFEGCLVPEPTR